MDYLSKNSGIRKKVLQKTRIVSLYQEWIYFVGLLLSVQLLSVKDCRPSKGVAMNNSIYACPGHDRLQWTMGNPSYKPETTRLAGLIKPTLPNWLISDRASCIVHRFTSLSQPLIVHLPIHTVMYFHFHHWSLAPSHFQTRTFPARPTVHIKPLSRLPTKKVLSNVYIH